MRIYKYKNFSKFEYVAEIIVENKLFCSAYDKLNDVFEGRYQYIELPSNISIPPENVRVSESIAKLEHLSMNETIRESYKNEKEIIRICSLSKKKDIILLWGYYAGGFSGIVFELEVDEMQSDIDLIAEVNYVDELPLITMKDGVFSLSPQELFLIKTKFWEHEHEVRILSHKKHVEAQLKKVILGYHITDDNERRIRCLVDLKNSQSEEPILIEKQRISEKDIFARPLESTQAGV